MLLPEGDRVHSAVWGLEEDTTLALGGSQVGVRVAAFEWWWEDRRTSTDSNGNTSTSWDRESIVAALVRLPEPADLPGILVQREGVFSRMGMCGRGDFQVESEEVNRCYDIRVTDKKRAIRLFDADFQAALLRDFADVTFEVGGSWALVVSGTPSARVFAGESRRGGTPGTAGWFTRDGDLVRHDEEIVAKGYAAHEQEVFAQVTRARTAAVDPRPKVSPGVSCGSHIRESPITPGIRASFCTWPRNEARRQRQRMRPSAAGRWPLSCLTALASIAAPASPPRPNSTRPNWSCGLSEMVSLPPSSAAPSPDPSSGAGTASPVPPSLGASVEAGVSASVAEAGPTTSRVSTAVNATSTSRAGTSACREARRSEEVSVIMVVEASAPPGPAAHRHAGPAGTPDPVAGSSGGAGPLRDRGRATAGSGLRLGVAAGVATVCVERITGIVWAFERTTSCPAAHRDPTLARRSARRVRLHAGSGTIGMASW